MTPERRAAAVELAQNILDHPASRKPSENLLAQALLAARSDEVTGRTDLCPDCGHHLHRPKSCAWYDCPCAAAPAGPTEPGTVERYRELWRKEAEKHRRCQDRLRDAANPAPAGLDYAPPLPEEGCNCGACVYLVRKQHEAFVARLQSEEPTRE